MLRIILAFIFCFSCLQSLADDHDIDLDSEYEDFYKQQQESRISLSDDANNINHLLFDIDHKIQHKLMKPVMIEYNNKVPKIVGEMTVSLFENINEPIHIMNSIFIGKFEEAFKAFWRFFINSTIGVFGLFDVASEFGLELVRTNFESTLLSNARRDLYLVLPIIGPTSFSITIGMFMDSILNPLNYIIPSYIVRSIFLMHFLHTKSEVYEIEEYIRNHSPDPYVSWRNILSEKIQLMKNK